MTGYEDYNESPTMREIHRIQEEMEQQYKKSGLSSYEEWLQATEPDLRQSLTEVGYRMVTRGDRFFLYEIKPRLKKNKKYRTLPKVGDRVVSTPPKTKMGNHKNYDDYIETSAAQEFQGVREDRTSSDKIEPSPQKPPVKYKTAAKRRKMNSRKK